MYMGRPDVGKVDDAVFSFFQVRVKIFMSVRLPWLLVVTIVTLLLPLVYTHCIE